MDEDPRQPVRAVGYALGVGERGDGDRAVDEPADVCLRERGAEQRGHEAPADLHLDLSVGFEFAEQRRRQRHSPRVAELLGREVAQQREGGAQGGRFDAHQVDGAFDPAADHVDLALEDR